MAKEKCPLCGCESVGGEQGCPEARWCMGGCGAGWDVGKEDKASIINEEGTILTGPKAKEYAQTNLKKLGK